MNRLLQMLDIVSVTLGRCVAVLAVVALALFIVEKLALGLLRRAGLFGLLWQFAWQQCEKSPRGFFAMLFWGNRKR